MKFISILRNQNPRALNKKLADACGGESGNPNY